MLFRSPSLSFVFTCVTTHGPASMTVQGVCFPSGPKMLVIPIFLPIIPFIVFNFCPFSVKWTVRYDLASIPVCYRPFPFAQTTGPEVPIVNKPRRACLYFHSPKGEKISFSAPFSHANGNQLGDEMKKNCCFQEETRSKPSGFDFNIYATGKVKLAQRINSAGR